MAGRTLEQSSSPPKRVPSLPFEVWMQIAAYNDFRTIKLLRLTNRFFGDALVRRLFHTIYVGPFDYSIDRLQCISESTHIRPVVRAIVFTGTLLCNKTFDKWLKGARMSLLKIYKETLDVNDPNFRRVLGSISGFREVSNRDLAKQRDYFEQSYIRFKELIDEQRRVLSEVNAYKTSAEIGPTLRRIGYSIQKLSPLKLITMEQMEGGYVGNIDQPLWLNLWPKILVHPYFDRNINRDDKELAIYWIMDAMIRYQNQIETLRISSSGNGVFSRRNQNYKAFSCVRMLDLEFGPDDGWNFTWNDNLFTHLTLLLRHAENLEVLRLYIDEAYGITDFLDSKEMLAAPLNKIRSLQILFEFSESTLLRFLELNSRTLKEVRFLGGDLRAHYLIAWPLMLAKIPSAVSLKYLDLKRIDCISLNNTRRVDSTLREMLGDKTWKSQMKGHILEGKEAPTFDPGVWFANHAHQPETCSDSTMAQDTDEEEKFDCNIGPGSMSQCRF